MKHIALPAMLVALVIFAAICGCTGTPQPAPTPVPTIEITPAATPAPVPTPDPFPDASALNTPVPFGTGTKTGELTVTGYTVRSMYSWIDPSWNSPREQLESSDPLETQKGYDSKQPHDGNTFLFVYITAASTGTDAVWAPSPAQIVVMNEGKIYTYSTISSGETVVDGEPGTQYDFDVGKGGTGGYVLPGKSNIAKGFLIYEVPASFSPEATYVVANADAKTQGVWKLA
ncbi:MAG: hypothetical protein M0Q92_05420 [Methanoregula sp.]|jgi:hypothetical protein|nr:hypothetical protein [Methanoregula sp.]